MSRDDLHFRLRLPSALKAEIETAAERNARSMTAEIVARLSAAQVSLRDQIAIAALSGMLAYGFRPTEVMVPERSSYDFDTPEQCAEYHAQNEYTALAYRIADRLIAEREKGGA